MSVDWLKRFWVRRSLEPGENLVPQFQSGTAAFASPYRDVAIPIAVGTTTYHVTLQSAENPEGHLGEVWYERISDSLFRVYRSGTSTNTFSWELRSLIIPGSLYHGSSNFVGGGNFVTIATGFDFGVHPYNVNITPLAPNTSVNVGEFWYSVVNGSSFRVYNSGASTGPFTWAVSKRV